MLSGDSGNKILDVQLVRCDEVKNSNAMEPEGLQRSLHSLSKQHVKIGILATDRNLTVAKMMRENYQEIKHEFDIWHIAKNITKKLTEKAKSSKNDELLPWIQSIANHFWWCCSESKGDEQLLREMWLSLLYHITGVHEWSGCVKFHRCAHYVRPQEEEELIPYLDKESGVYAALKSIVMDKNLLKALRQVTCFCHTGELEVFHSMMLKYCPKRQHFGYEGMTARTMLAVLDWNNRERHAVVRDGQPVFDQVHSKRRRSWILRRRYAIKTSNDFRKDIMDYMLFEHDNNSILSPIKCPDNLGQNIAHCIKPNKANMLLAHASRFDHN